MTKCKLVAQAINVDLDKSLIINARFIARVLPKFVTPELIAAVYTQLYQTEVIVEYDSYGLRGEWATSSPITEVPHDPQI